MTEDYTAGRMSFKKNDVLKLRNQFVMAALTGLLANPSCDNNIQAHLDMAVSDSINVADEMMRVLGSKP